MTKKTPKDRFSTLTEREKDVLRMVCSHKSYQEIADALFISKNTVKTHMHKIYVKLGLDDLNRDERVIAIHNIFNDFFSGNDRIDIQPQKNAIIEIMPEPEPLSPREEEIIDGDEMALIAYNPPAITTKGRRKMDGTKKKKRGCIKFIFVLILGVALTIGAWQAWLYLREIPIVISIMQLINPDMITAAQEEKPSFTQPTAKPTTAPTAKSAPQTSAPQVQTSGVNVMENNTDGIFELDQWSKQDGVWLRLADFEVSGGRLRFNFEIWNRTGKEIYFSWTAPQNFSLTDNKNSRYEVMTTSTYKVTVKNEERLHFSGMGKSTVIFIDDPIFESGVTDLYLTAEFISKIEKAVFHVALGN